jgi:hypothetical protein
MLTVLAFMELRVEESDNRVPANKETRVDGGRCMVINAIKEAGCCDDKFLASILGSGVVRKPP